MKDYYRILEVHNSASPEVIRKAYETLAKKYHPDQNPNDIEYATDKMKEINEAYEVLSNTEKRRQYDLSYEEYLREQYSMGEKKGSNEKSETIKTEDKGNTKKSPDFGFFSYFFILFFIILIVFVLINSNDLNYIDDDFRQTDNSKTAYIDVGYDLARKLISDYYDEGIERDIYVPKLEESKSYSYITIGSTKDDVKRIMGLPTVISENLWYYDYSIIQFNSQNIVIGWAEIDTKLKVSLGKKDQNTEPFTLGSTKEEVIKAMGTPTAILLGENTWIYNTSIVFFENNNVVGWFNFEPKLKVFLGKKSNNAPPFTKGSTKTDVLRAMGTPQIVLDNIWAYGFSIIEFDDENTVISWEEHGTELKVN